MSINNKVVMLSMVTGQSFRVQRSEDEAVIRLGDLGVYVDMETLRDLCNDMAEVLDAWYDERDRRGQA